MAFNSLTRGYDIRRMSTKYLYKGWLKSKTNWINQNLFRHLLKIIQNDNIFMNFLCRLMYTDMLIQNYHTIYLLIEVKFMQNSLLILLYN